MHRRLIWLAFFALAAALSACSQKDDAGTPEPSNAGSAVPVGSAASSPVDGGASRTIESNAPASPDGAGSCCPPSTASDSCDPSFLQGGFSLTTVCAAPTADFGDVKKSYDLRTDGHGCTYWQYQCTYSPARVCGAAYIDAGPVTCD